MFMNKPERYLSRQALYGEIVTADLLTNYYASDEKMKRLVTELFFHIQRAFELSPHLAIRYFRQVLGYDAYLEETAASLSEKEKRKEIITALQESFRKMKRTEKVNDFLRKAEAQMLEGKKEENTDVQTTKGISVLTMHSAKGLEFSYVFLPDLNEGIIPGRSSKTKESIEEERRLLYVAITRAKEFLYLYYTGERNRKPTRFLKKVLTQK